MVVDENVSLKRYNTFGIEAKARYFVEIRSIPQLQELLGQSGYADMPKLILGGGSNLLFTQDFEGLVIKNNIAGIKIVKENEENVWIAAGGGENWHQFVLYCIERGFAGIENLSLIPGTVGAAPMQNIGAYGVEIKDYFHTLEAIEIDTGKSHTFDRESCQFGYRNSVFKNELKGRYLIVRVTFQLNKKPQFHTSYGAIRNTLDAMGVKEITIKAVSDAVIHIRQSKLPDPATIGNAGSFFKNPTINKDIFENLRERFPEIPGYDAPGGMIKVPAGWLIEQCGWKGRKAGNVGVHKNQALVLVNLGNARGYEVKKLAEDIQESVMATFGIILTAEVNMV